MRFLLTTDPGLESVAGDEILERAPSASVNKRPYGVAGHVRVDLDDPGLLFGVSTIHHVIEIRAEAEAVTLHDVRRVVHGIEIPELKDAESFRVTTSQCGAPPLDRREVQGAAGAVLQRRHGTRVDLKGFAVNVRVDRFGTWLVVGLQRTRDSLGNRLRRARPLRSSLKPTIAAALIRLVGAHRGAGRLIDPMCGAATIPVEAKRLNPSLTVLASDWDRATVTVARETVARHAVDVEVAELDARSLDRSFGASFDYIVTDPPYGVRQARRVDPTHLYASLLTAFDRSLRPAGRIALVVLKYRAFLRALEPSRLRVVDELTVESGGLCLQLYSLDRRS